MAHLIQTQGVISANRLPTHIPIEIDPTGFPYRIPAQPSPQSRIIGPVVGEVEAGAGMEVHAGIAEGGLNGALASGQGFW